MPERKKHSLYNIEPLESLIERGFVLLTPNLRITRRIKAVWNSLQLEAGRGVWQPLRVNPLESWLEEQWHRAVELGLLPPQVVVGEGMLVELWQQVIAEHQLNSEHYTLLRPSAAAELANRARENLIRWQVDTRNSTIRQEFLLDVDCATYYAWQDLLQARLDKLGLISPAQRVAQLYEVADKMPGENLALLEFDDIPPLQLACVRALADNLEQRQSVGSVGQQVARAYADRHSELLALARWARAQNLASPQATIGIIVPDMNRDRATVEHFLRREFGSAAALPVNFSAGTRLNRTPIVRDALLALNFCRSRASVEDTVKLLQSRFVNLPDHRGELAVKFTVALFDDGIEQLEIGEIRYRASQVKVGDSQGLSMGACLMSVSQMRSLQKRHRPSEWVDVFTEVLAVWGWPGPASVDSLEFQQLESWYQLLEEFSGHDAIAESLSLDDALSWLARCAARKLFQPKTADSSIQVLGMLEGAGLSFDHLWLCGMQATSWPAPARPSPLIPLALQRRLNMPHASAEREATFASALLARYIRSAPEVNASYVQMQDGVPELPSALLRDFQWQPGAADECELDPLWTAQRASAALESLLDDVAPVVAASEASRLGGGSGLIEDQSHCPFRAFAKRRLRVQALGEFHTGLSPAARGSILHDALFCLWGGLGDSSTLHSSSEQSLQQRIAEAAQAGVQSLPARVRINLGQAYLELEVRRLQSLLQEWLEIEKARSDFAVYAAEQDITLVIPPLEISLRVDRIDQLEDGSQFIIDYKSGRSSVSDWLGQRPAKPQLLLYGLASSADPERHTVAALSFAQVRPRDCSYVGAGEIAAAPGVRTDIAKLAGEKLQADDWDSLNRAWQGVLERLVAEFAGGEAKVDPLTASSCSYCGLQALCRVGEQREVIS